MSAMSPSNHTGTSPSFFILVGIPGKEELHLWISIPFFLMYLVALSGNSGLLLIIATERSLHQPMYLFLSLLAGADLMLTTTTVPKMLDIFWADAGEIPFAACIAQTSLLVFLFVSESAVLLAMAFDRYVAICRPLRYTMVLTPRLMVWMGVAGVVRSCCTAIPFAFLLKRLPYCKTNVIPHTYCEHMAVAALSCGDITANNIYGLAVSLLSTGLDVVLIAVSYVLILRSIFRMPSRDARGKALSTCGSHVCVILMFYTPAYFTILAHRFGQNIPRYVHILLANMYLLLPPMLNPIIYGVKTKEIREQAVLLFSQIGKRC
ncbi:olfactory receptor 52Z1P-like isoform X1 [Podarcis raffonei]|uniref:olfactory receptor 52Z1P-like isoform X1 n=2 Tax=Podarcis raffonei TaxID=65483 RepID=UPI0023292B86|nr:olfactory receptor 52Z1P-like isoform X1 [Podarcis raffonei]